MDVLSPVSDDEREDGEIVDDDLEDISDYTIPSDGKSDYSEGIIRTISLSSISGSDGEREYCESKLWVFDDDSALDGTAKRRLRRRASGAGRARSTQRERKRRRDANQPRARRAKRRRSCSRSASESSGSGASLGRHVINNRTLRQLNKAVRIDTNASTAELRQQHRSLKERLKQMIQHEDGMLDANDKHENHQLLDETMDKELEELRLQALKSAMLKKHLERKKRKEALNTQMGTVTTSAVLSTNDKENDSNNSNGLHETKTIAATAPTALSTAAVEDDVDIMRAMLLASMTEKITSEQSSINPIQSAYSNLTLSSSSSPIPSEFMEKRKAPPFTPVKPLIIRANHASESDTDFDNDDADVGTGKQPEPVAQKIESSVEELLRRQREQFEAKLEQNKNTRITDGSPLGKSILKLLPKSQQQEYKQLRQKLLQAKNAKNAKTARATVKSKSSAPAVNSKINPPNDVKQKQARPREKKESRPQPKGKYRELAPLVRRIQAELAAQRQQKEHVQRLMEQLKEARTQLASHNQRHADLVAQFKKARAIIDLRWQKQKLVALEKAAQLGVGSGQTKTKAPAAVKAETRPVSNASVLIGGSENNNVAKGDDSTRTGCATARLNVPLDQNEPVANVSDGAETKVVDEIVPELVSEPLSYVSPLDKRETNGNNPLRVLCPYELFGVCKDAACTFNHCP